MLGVLAVDGSIIVGPKDAVVIAGTRVVLTCQTSTTASVKWYHEPYASPLRTSDLIYDAPNFTQPDQKRYDINRTIPNNFDLIIPAADSNYSGRYFCHHDIDNTEASAVLVVITNLACSTNATMTDANRAVVFIDQDVALSCVVEYFGEMNATLLWTSTVGGGIRGPNPKQQLSTDNRMGYPIVNIRQNFAGQVLF